MIDRIRIYLKDVDASTKRKKQTQATWCAGVVFTHYPSINTVEVAFDDDTIIEKVRK